MRRKSAIVCCREHCRCWRCVPSKTPRLVVQMQADGPREAIQVVTAIEKILREGNNGTGTRTRTEDRSHTG